MTANSQLPPADEGRLDLLVVPLVERLRLHIARMAPHQKERLGGALLIECGAELERLCALIPKPLGDPWQRAAEMLPKPCAGTGCDGEMRGNTNGYSVYLRCVKCGAVPMLELRHNV